MNNKEKRKSLRGFTGGCEGGEETQKRASESFSHHSLPASHCVVEFKLAVIQRNRTLIASASSLVCFLFNSVSFSISHCSTLLDICNLAVLYWYYASLRLRIYTAGILYFFYSRPTAHVSKRSERKDSIPPCRYPHAYRPSQASHP